MLFKAETKRTFKRQLRRARRQICFGIGGLKVDIDRSVTWTLLGTEYGGWPIISGSVNPSSVVYSFGVGEDISFDIELIERFGATVHAFDPTPRSLEWMESQQPLEGFTFHPVGIGDRDGTLQLFPPTEEGCVSYSIVRKLGTQDPINCPIKRLSSIMKDLGHVKVDVLKLDIEGVEYDVIPDFLESGFRPEILLVEFHHRVLRMGIQKTKVCVEALKMAGYRVFYLSDLGDEFGFWNPGRFVPSSIEIG